MTVTDTELTISEMAEATGLSVHTLRYYEREGLMLTPVERASSSHRRYTAGDVRWVIFLGRLRSTAMPVREIRRYAEHARQGDASAPDRLALLVEHRERVLASLAEITASLAAIDYKIAHYTDLSKAQKGTTAR